ncbi:MAG TPA: PspC domain-containing protein [Candidatus Atopostipes pullistercoris]|uniref:PspC domain-containing protein n=1 Tax=Candidatus Atopostipes pullistercoris TaxID=2838467 RepID=A0A9D2G0S9_9LACT|nr:PspC domain-containing protein [Candidatus Atopostipes pullistercoris]
MRLTKSRDDIVVSGVLAGIGEYYNIDPTLLRIGFVVLTFVGVGGVIPLYILAAFIIPKAPRENDRDRRRFDRRNPRDRQFNRSKRPDDQQTANKDDYSSKAKEIDEEDWSDF